MSSKPWQISAPDEETPRRAPVRGVILNVDDTPLTRRIVTGILQRAGYVVHEAATGADALLLAKTLPDLILLDVELPDIHGLEVARRLKEHAATARIPVLHLSATRVTDEDRARGLDRGADGYLVHPVEPQVLLSTIRAYLRIRSATDRILRLQALTTALSGAETVEAVAEVVLHDGVAAAGATDVAILRSVEDEPALEVLAASPGCAAMPAGRRIPVSSSGPPGVCTWTGEPVWIGERSLLEADYPHAAAEWAGASALAWLPLRIEGRIWGTLGLSFHEPQAFADADRASLVTIAAQCELALARARLREAERRARSEETRIEAALRESLRAREDMVAIVSHDLRDPLGVITMAAGMIRSGVTAGIPSAQLGRLADRILGAATHMNDLMRALLDAASIEAGRFQLALAPTPIDPILAEAVELFGPAAGEKGITLSLECEAGLSATCDRPRVLQALSNLVGNALKFTPRGEAIRLHARRDGDRVRVIVTDSGVGIPEEQLPHLFDRYWKGESGKGAGTGLGLFIVKGIIEAHGGDIAVESRPGAGTTFSFTVPVA